MKPIYVAFTDEEGKKRWIKNPTTYVDGRLVLFFMESGAVAGLDLQQDKHEGRIREYRPVLQDELDLRHIEWSRPSKGTFCAKVIEGAVRELFLVSFVLAGPLPYAVASRMQGTVVSRPMAIMHRFGG